MRNHTYPVEIIYQSGGAARVAAYSVDPHDPKAEEEARLAAIRRTRNKKDSRRKKRRRFEKMAAALPDVPKPAQTNEVT